MNRALAFAFLALAAAPASASAETPVAIVEDIRGNVRGVELMDYLTPKTVIKLGQNGSIVISYMGSCERETITGIGTVIVGTDESSVHLADIKRERFACDAVHAHATTRETSAEAATIVRSLRENNASSLPQTTLFGASPLVDAKGKGTLVIERLDLAGDREQFELDGTQLKGRFFDFASRKRALVPGGVYLATFGSSKIVFRIDQRAKPGATPMLGRLLQMN